MSAFQKFNSFVEQVFEKVHNLGADTLKVMLSNTAPNSTNVLKADITELAAANGYVAGGVALTVVSSSQTGGVYKLVVNDATITASGGTIGPFRYAIVYNDTPSSPLKPLIGFYDYGTALTIPDTQSLIIDFDNTNGLLQSA